MLEIKKITKIYETEDLKQKALDNISINFRTNEFASILGPSGSGKTTLLNIIGGLDRYTTGDLIINEVSTKQFKDRDWDSYRNHRVGFVFQNYNLISHQTILANVELALTLSGVGKLERTKRAKEALKKVGLKEHMNKKPNQLSGGQMQRVAIARALVNDPEILLADEPTGALDSVTSVQIMDILKEIAKDKLVIMVTHNPELAKNYSTRIVELKDGKIISDSDPYDGKIDTKEELEERMKKSKKTSMNLKTALSLSLNNLMTKKGRTILTAFAGSIGIIGIALILSLSNGVQEYIHRVEEDTLSSYPLTIQKVSVDTSSMMLSLMGEKKNIENYDENKIYSNNIMTDVISSFANETKNNDLKTFKAFLEQNSSNIKDYVSDIKYSYNLNLNLYKVGEEKITKVNPSTVFDNLNMGVDTEHSFGSSMMMGEMNSWTELTGNEKLLKTQYDLIAGSWPTKYNEVVLVVTEDNQVSDYALYSLGLLDQDELKEMVRSIMTGEKIESKQRSFTFDDIIGLKYKLVLNTDYYKHENGVWVDHSEDETYMKQLLEKAEDIEVVGIIRVNEESTISTTGVIGYREELTKYVIDQINNSEIAKAQVENQEINVFTGLKFSEKPSFSMEDLTAEERAYLLSLPEQELAKVIAAYTENAEATYESNLLKLGIVELDNPDTINIYPLDFESKEEIVSIIENYNKGKKEEEQISYTDFVGVMMKSVTSIINIISYVLMAFVSISLIVSSIMIGIITYISVLERTKEIGILRAIGASKKDVSRVFNAETMIEGLIAGLLGVGVAYLITIPVNLIVKSILNVNRIAHLALIPALILITISILLTVIAGLFPARLASKKDPVESLRSE